jgi:catalase
MSTASAGVVCTTAADDDLPDQFADDFVIALVKSQTWERQAHSIPT